MRPFTATQLLDAWEQGLSQPHNRWALTMLAAACPEDDLDHLGQLTIGRRDALLLTLREWLFGTQLESTPICPHCGEQLALVFSSADLQSGAPVNGDSDSDLLTLTVDNYEVRFRLPNSLDLLAIAEETNSMAARQCLLGRCLLEVCHQETGRPIGELPVKVVTALAERMDEADPQANIQLSLTCPACGHDWQVLFDIVAFLRAEVDSWARRTLREVHELASAYGWREADILAMSAWRRRIYLGLVGR
jgi:hypothetical protein